MKFNKATPGTKTTNLAGGQAHSQSAELELVSILLTSMGQDQYYRSEKDTYARLKELISKCNKEFVAKAIVYARTEFGMRTITHIAASELAKYVGGNTWAKNFYDRVIYRPDDMMEILAYHYGANQKLSASMKKGFAFAFNRFDAYNLAKYRGEGKDIKLVDIVNLVHPTPTEKNQDAIKQLINGTLKSTDTWESKLTKIGQLNDDEADKVELKKEAWGDLIRSKKLGYLALLRNLRNIMEQAPDALNEALESLTNESFIKKTLIFPFQYLVAYKQFLNIGTKEGRLITQALSKAIDISAQNLKSLDLTGNTLVVIDNSGSMSSTVAKSEHMQCNEMGALFGISFAKAFNADIMEFGDRARYIPYTLDESSMNFAMTFSSKNKVGHGTNFHAIFPALTKKYDRVLIFSDMQGWMGGYSTPKKERYDYCLQYGASPMIYSFDLRGYGSMQFPEDKTVCLAGYSDKVFDLMKTLERDKNALINEIKAVKL